MKVLIARQTGLGMRFKFSKRDRLRSKKHFGLLFDQGNSLFVYPIKMVFILVPEELDIRLRSAVSVPKRLHKRAAIRNLLKRRMRESIRTNKAWLLDRLPEHGQLAVLYIYVAKEVETYQVVDQAIKTLNRKWIRQESSKNKK